MIVDTSALIAIACRWELASRTSIEADSVRLVSAWMSAASIA